MSVNLDLDHRGKPVYGVVIQPVDDYVVGVEVKSRPWILPLIDTLNVPLQTPQCRERHIIRTDEHVVVVDVITQVYTYPRSLTIDQIRQNAKESVDEESPNAKYSEEYEKAIEAIVNRITKKLLNCGVEVR